MTTISVKDLALKHSLRPQQINHYVSLGLPVLSEKPRTFDADAAEAWLLQYSQTKHKGFPNKGQRSKTSAELAAAGGYVVDETIKQRSPTRVAAKGDLLTWDRLNKRGRAHAVVTDVVAPEPRFDSGNTMQDEGAIKILTDYGPEGGPGVRDEMVPSWLDAALTTRRINHSSPEKLIQVLLVHYRSKNDEWAVNVLNMLLDPSLRPAPLLPITLSEEEILQMKELWRTQGSSTNPFLATFLPPPSPTPQ